MFSRKNSDNNSLTVFAALAILSLIILAAVGSILIFYDYFGTQHSTSVSTSTSNVGSSVTKYVTSTSVQSSTTSSGSSSQSLEIPASLTWETPNTVDYLDPHVSYTAFAYSVLQNVYEPLLWYNSSCSSCVIPWLAQNYTSSPDLSTYNFTLRSGIKFADGEQLNSTSVFFSLNRLLIEDGSTPVSHGTQASFILQQLLNSSLSSTLCGCSQDYNPSYVDSVLSQNFISISGPLTFSIHVQNPNSAFPYMLGDIGSDIIAPLYVMNRDVALWNQSSSEYDLPFPRLYGSEFEMIHQYFMDEAATCNSGATPAGCGTTFLDGSESGSLAGTGPYEVSSFVPSTNNIVLTANPNYWGGPHHSGPSKNPIIATINVEFVPSQQTRIIDLRNAAASGKAMTVDVEPDHIYDVADRNIWLENNTLRSVIPEVNVFGPYKSFYTYFDAFSTNVTDPATGEFYQFQPFSDLRFRLAFADSINMTEINLEENNGLGQVALNVVPPGLPPSGSYNSAIKPLYSFNLSAVQELLLEAMQHPITKFSFVNGTVANPGLFNNTFGCKTLGSDEKCTSPVSRTISLTYYTGDTVDESIFESIAGVINNVSNTFNLGLSVSVTPEPFGYMSTLGFSDELYMYMIGGWGDDYPWVMDFLGPMYAPGQVYSASDGWNISEMGQFYNAAVTASSSGNITGLVKLSNEMNEFANQKVLYLWTFYPYSFAVITSNVKGYYFNPSLAQVPTGFYFASLS